MDPFVARRLFDRPASTWASGHRGVDIAADTGGEVLSPGPGVVTFAGTVVNRGVVTVAHDSGLVSSVEPVDAVVAVGDRVHAGDVLGTVEARAWHCDTACIHWGVRLDGDYLNPLDALAGFGPVRLLPAR